MRERIEMPAMRPAISRTRGRALATGIALAAIAALSPTHAGAQTLASAGAQVKAQHGAWAVMCERPVGATSDQCGAAQEVVSDARPDLGITVTVFETADRAARVMRVLAPLGTFLPRGLGLNLDGEDLGRAVYLRCIREGCQAEVVLDDALIERMKAGSEATFIIYQTPEKGTGFPVDLNGFGKAFDVARAGGEPEASTPAPASNGTTTDDAPADGAETGNAADESGSREAGD